RLRIQRERMALAAEEPCPAGVRDHRGVVRTVREPWKGDRDAFLRARLLHTRAQTAVGRDAARDDDRVEPERTRPLQRRRAQQVDDRPLEARAHVRQRRDDAVEEILAERRLQAAEAEVVLAAFEGRAWKSDRAAIAVARAAIDLATARVAEAEHLG